MQGAFLTATYIAAHTAAAMLCCTSVVILPLLVAVVAAFSDNDPGGQMFWPIFVLLLLAAGIATAFVCSVLVLVVDLARLRWRLPVWVPPATVFSATSLCFAPISSWQDCVLIASGCCAVFSLYWLAVSSAWFLPRRLVQLVRSRSSAA